MTNADETLTMPDASAGRAVPRPSLGEALRFWLKLGCISFGGPAGQIAIMQTELVDKRRWIDQRAFLRGLNFCTLLPGPEAQQLATYIGWRLHGTLGGIIAGGLFVLPGALLLLLLSWIAAEHGDTRAVAAVFDGLKPVVIAVIIAAVWRIGRRALKTWQAISLAAAAFVAIYFLGIDFPWIVLAAGLIGWLSGRNGPSPFASGGHGDDAVSEALPVSNGGLRRALVITAICIVLWAIPVALCVFAFGSVPFGDIAICSPRRRL